MSQGVGILNGLIVFVFVVVAILLASFRTVEQATVAVVTVFGKYHRIMREGLNIKWPWEKVAHRLSLQNRALQLEFQAITQDQANAERFLAEVDSAVVMTNASTRFTDGGEFGFGAEIGIATGKFHARGPVGAEQLTSFKYRIHGTGQTRP